MKGFFVMENTKFCTACGAELAETELFCHNCGAKQAAPAAEESVAPAAEAPAAEAPVAEAAPAAETVVAVEAPAAEAPAKPGVKVLGAPVMTFVKKSVLLPGERFECLTLVHTQRNGHKNLS